MKKLTRLILIPALLGLSWTDDSCSGSFLFKEGSQSTMTHYNEDGKIQGSSKTLYQKLTKTPTGMTIFASTENFDKKGRSQNKSEYSITCDKGILYYDMKSLMPQQQAEAYKDFEMTVEGVNKEMPTNLKPGSSLKDANVKFTFKSTSGPPMPMMNMEVKISNRKVEAEERITTAAGTYACLVISETVEVKTMFSVKMKSKIWYNAEAGTVKTMTFKENGKLSGYSELTEFKN